MTESFYHQLITVTGIIAEFSEVQIRVFKQVGKSSAESVPRLLCLIDLRAQ